MKMTQQIDDLIQRCEHARKTPNSYPFLPDVIEILISMRTHIGAAKSIRSGNAGALGRIVLEDFTFSESQLGTDLLKLGERFVE